MRKLEAIKSDLEAQLRALGAKVEEIEEDLRTPRSAGWEDRATEIEGDEVLDALEESALAEIRDIRTALQRIDEGSYEICSSCGKKINDKRLEALPYATECIQCAERA